MSLLGIHPKPTRASSASRRLWLLVFELAAPSLVHVASTAHPGATLRAILKHCRANRLVKVIDRTACGVPIQSHQFQLEAGQVVCFKCRAIIRDPRPREMQQEQASWPRILVCFTSSRKGYAAHGLALDCTTALGPWVKVESAQTLRKLLAYLGATGPELDVFDRKLRGWGQGSAEITLAPGRKSLLKLRCR